MSTLIKAAFAVAWIALLFGMAIFIILAIRYSRKLKQNRLNLIDRVKLAYVWPVKILQYSTWSTESEKLLLRFARIALLTGGLALAFTFCSLGYFGFFGNN